MNQESTGAGRCHPHDAFDGNGSGYGAAGDENYKLQDSAANAIGITEFMEEGEGVGGIENKEKGFATKCVRHPLCLPCSFRVFSFGSSEDVYCTYPLWG